MVADYSSFSPEIKRWLERFNSISIPLTVIFPGNRPDRPIVLRDVYSKTTLLEKLQQAVNADATAATSSAIAQQRRHAIGD